MQNIVIWTAVLLSVPVSEPLGGHAQKLCLTTTKCWDISKFQHTFLNGCLNWAVLHEKPILFTGSLIQALTCVRKEQEQIQSHLTCQCFCLLLTDVI